MPLKLVRYKQRGNNWYVRGTVRGEALFETTGTDDAKAAEAIRIRRESELLQRSVFGAGATVSFLEAAVSYLEQGGEARYLGALDPVTGRWSLLIGLFGSRPIAQIGQVEADDAAAKLYPDTSAATKKRQAYVPISAVLNHAAEKWKISVARIKHPRVRPVQVRWAPPEYVSKLVLHCAPALRRLVMTLVYTGGRLSEVLALDWDMDVDLGARALTFGRTKNDEMRTAHVPDPLLLELVTVEESERHGRVFHWSHKSHVHGPLRTACKRAGIPYMSPHKLGRHTYATWLRRYAKRDLRGLMEDGGWKSINSVVRYAHVVAGETATAVDRLPAVQNMCTSQPETAKPLKKQIKIA